MTNDKHFNYVYKLGKGVSRRTKKYIRNYWEKDYELYKQTEEYLMDQLPNCKWCNGVGIERVGIWDTGYACPDCRGTGKDGWQYDKQGKMVMMKEFIKPSNNAIRLKRKGVLKKGEGRESIPKEDTKDV
ncbi:hypothetical protein [Paenibacillus sp. ACRRY]|uniref:hypothetical protein n=1 Tax=Paenibacillus sp. ACRRY TaxID=2918208 RepID=UPI001EF3EAE5|nr:hypothetical protein [Paenibacillus sp. ACRRY]MCG7385081.1 hypothetical protein [Paenibacillus sp. ACRRY]